MFCVYQGIRTPEGCIVWVGSHFLPLADSLRLRNHSPDGFEWGYGGSGPAQLALAILLHHTRNPALALQYYQQFKWQIIAAIHGNHWSISGPQIDAWLKKQ